MFEFGTMGKKARSNHAKCLIKMKKVQSNMTTSHCDEKKKFLKIKQDLCGYSDNSCKGMVNLFGGMFPIAKLLQNCSLLL